jgi:calcineurin-like phosphoesterase family protein
MVEIWYASDHHFDHRNMIDKFTLADGSPARSFATVEEMNDVMIERHNAVVKSHHHVWFLGDLTMHRQIGQIQYTVLDRLNGHKRLLLGNHDLDKVENYLKWFEKVKASHVHDRLLFTHIPVHPESLGRFQANVHGHTHHRVLPPVIITDHKGYGQTERVVPYINVCVEQTDYRPVSLEQIKEKVSCAVR